MECLRRHTSGPYSSSRYPSGRANELKTRASPHRKTTPCIRLLLLYSSSIILPDGCGGRCLTPACGRKFNSPASLTSCCSTLLSRPSRAARRLSSAEEWAVCLTLLCRALLRLSSVPDITELLFSNATLSSSLACVRARFLILPVEAGGGEGSQGVFPCKQRLVSSVLCQDRRDATRRAAYCCVCVLM